MALFAQKENDDPEPVSASRQGNEGIPKQAGQSGPGSRLIARVLPPAVRLWLQSQLDQVEALEFQLGGRDRQILRGYVPTVTLSAVRAVYQGLHLSQVQAEASEIYINLGQVVRGKPLRLLQPFPVRGRVIIAAADLNVSLASSLLRQALQDFLAQLWAIAHSPLQAQFADATIPVESAQAAIEAERLHLTIATPEGVIVLQAGLTVRDGQVLVLNQPTMNVHFSDPGAPAVPMPDIEFDLGSEVAIDALSLSTGQLEVYGTVQVLPGD
ncbi:DUF2993 domain-containing protein [filamentous cyanobacterium CCP5]|nr:DUF2993 domain-containing protein [filamentous cyanobacterium CCP5]